MYVTTQLPKAKSQSKIMHDAYVSKKSKKCILNRMLYKKANRRFV